MKREGMVMEPMHIPARRRSTTAYVEALSALTADNVSINRG